MPQNTNSFVDPKAVVRTLPVELSGTVADFGCGAGYFSIEFARALGENGQVIAIDVLPSALEAVESQAKLQNIRNITVKRANLEHEGGSGLSAESVDWAIAKDMLFQNKEKETILREIFRVLRPGGYALIMEWDPEAGGSVGPEESLRVPKETLESLLKGIGFSETDDMPVGAFHYAFLVRK